MSESWQIAQAREALRRVDAAAFQKGKTENEHVLSARLSDLITYAAYLEGKVAWLESELASAAPEGGTP